MPGDLERMIPKMKGRRMNDKTDTAEPIAPWFGGKRYLARQIIERISAMPHDCYAEPFVGMGGVLLRKPSRCGGARSEIVNDRNGEIVNLFRVLREHPEELMRQFRWRLASRQEFLRMKDTPPEVFTDIQRAARFVYTQLMAYAGKPTTRGMGARTKEPHWGVIHVLRRIEAAHRRIIGVHIECLDWREFVARVDRPHTLFYIDPPYPGNEDVYGTGMFSGEDFAELAERLAGIKGRFILSLSDRPEIREMFGWAAIETVRTAYSAAPARQHRTELLIGGGAGGLV